MWENDLLLTTETQKHGNLTLGGHRHGLTILNWRTRQTSIMMVSPNLLAAAIHEPFAVDSLYGEYGSHCCPQHPSSIVAESRTRLCSGELGEKVDKGGLNSCGWLPQ